MCYDGNMKDKTPKHVPVANPAYHRAMVELRRSNASGTHDARPKRERSRNAAKRAEIRRNSE